MSLSHTYTCLVVLLVYSTSPVSAADYTLRQVALTSANSQLHQQSQQLSPDSQPMSMASGDFDGDGVVDLIVSYASDGDAYLALYRGNHDYIYPFSAQAQQRKRDGLAYDSPFFPAAEIVPIEQGFDFLAAGDFDADGQLDLAGGARGQMTVSFFRGNGHGGLELSTPIVLEGALNLMQSGEVNRRDGLVDLVLAIDTDTGSQLLVFEAPTGAFSRAPESILLPESASSVAMGELDGQPGLEIAIAAGNELILVRGRDRGLTLANEAGETASLAVVERQSLGAKILGLAFADLVKDGESQGELSVLLDSGQVETLQLETLHQAAPKVTSKIPATQGPASHWQRLESRQIEGNFTEDSAPAVSPVFMDDQVYWLVNQPELESGSQLPEDEIVAILPLRLNADGLMDQVVLKRRSNSLQVDTTQGIATVTVNSTADSTVSGDGLCTLREAIINTNNGGDASGGNCAAGTAAGADEIVFNIPNGGNRATITMTGSLPTITDPVTINGNSQCATPPCVKLDGSGVADPADHLLNALTVDTGSSVIRGLVFADWPFSGIQLQGASGGNLIEGNHFGVDFDGATAAPLLGTGVQIKSPNNTVGGTTASARNIMSNNRNGITILNTDATNAAGNTIAGNFIGTDITGTVGLGNTFNGIYAAETSNNTIGGVAAGSGNLISGGNGVGLVLRETDVAGKVTTGNLVQGNLIGTDVTGMLALGNNDDGIRLWDASGNTIGGTSVAARNIISGNGHVNINRHGVVIFQTQDFNVPTSNNLVQGNYIGVNVNGTADLGNQGAGIVVGSVINNTIGGTEAGAGNVISGNDWVGIYVYLETNLHPTTDNKIQGNRIGTNAAGTAALANSTAGIFLSSADNNLIGGTTADAVNVISGNGYGIIITASNDNTIQGNLIGTNATGTVAIANVYDGILLNTYTSNTLVGGTTAGARNIISGNNRGISFYDATNNTIQGNFIGTNAAGNAALPNTETGIVFAQSSTGNLIGGTIAGARNLISGNSSMGIGVFDYSPDNTFQGNFIGTDVLGTSAIPNGAHGIASFSLGAQTIGGDNPLARNVISGNLQQGIVLQIPSTGSIVKNNYIGVGSDGTTSIPNASNGILIVNSSGNQIGGVGVGNRIWGNSNGINLITDSNSNQIVGNDIQNSSNIGVVVQDTSAGNTLSQNLMFNNTALGIDLGTDGNGPTANDNLDPDSGPNNLQNFPILASATAGNPVITGSLNSLANTQFTIEYFSNSACDPSGWGEGQFYLGAKQVTTNGSGNADVGTSFASNVPAGYFVTATATAPDGSSSEFSPCVLTPGGGPVFTDGFES